MHRIYLVPGFFGFARLAGYDYFTHVRRALETRFRDAGVGVVIEVVPTPPTASIRRRAHFLAERVRVHASESEGPIHLIGHSTGGLDARLLASPTVQLALRPEDLVWRRRIASVVTLNTPHHGTPVAQFFTGVAGHRMLCGLSLLTVITLSVGGPPLSAAAALMATLGGLSRPGRRRPGGSPAGQRGEEKTRDETDLWDRMIQPLLGALDRESRAEVRAWLEGIHRDQGAILQLTPEAMDLFVAAAEDDPEVRYGCVATASPEPTTPWRRFGGGAGELVSRTLYATLHDIAADVHPHYPAPRPSPEDARRLHERIGRRPSEELNDGVVPLRSQLHGELLWCGAGDHLDVVGHFDGGPGSTHTDWLHSGAAFRDADLSELCDAVAGFLKEGR